ncbi:MAG: hypothetical protein KJO11_07285, partial [Gemmatimonadetes bacterium]|nr:hypothetical protein [Gemmatimonadota bacterium]
GLRAVARWRRRRRPSRSVTELERRMRFALASLRPEFDFEALARQAAETLTELAWIRACALRGGPVPVETSVEGMGRIGSGGSLLWGMSFCGTLVVKIALHRAGVPLVHLSAAGHGAAHPPTRLGLRIVSPLYCRAENRFLRERVVIPEDGSLGYLRTLMERLRSGAPVYIAGERRAPRRNTSALCLGRPTLFARGAPGLAHRSGVPLLPVTVYRVRPLHYRVVVEPPLDSAAAPGVDDGPTLDRDAFVADAIRAFADRVSHNVLEHPADWDWYRHTVPEWEKHAQEVE